MNPLYSGWKFWRQRLGGHYWTIGPRVGAARRPPSVPPSRPWSVPTAATPDAAVLYGRLHTTTGRSQLLVLVHGLGGCADSHYMRSATTEGMAAGFDVLRLNLRGADGNGDDLYHGGLSEDLAAVVASPNLAAYTRVCFLGFSLGGHVALRFATHVDDPRVVTVAAVCSPLDLAAGQKAIDRRRAWLYRHYLLRRLKATFERVAPAQGLSASLPAVRRATTLLDFDRHTVVPRFGFADPADYYRQASAGPRLGSLRIPCLLVAARFDPMVPAHTIEPWLASAPPDRLEVHWQETGGHVGMPPAVDLGMADARPGLEAQAVAWLARRVLSSSPR